MKRMIHRWMLTIATAVVAVLPAVQAQSAEVMNETGDMVRVMRHPDGTRAIYHDDKAFNSITVKEVYSV